MWEYRLKSSSPWLSGNGPSFTLTEGTYSDTDIQARLTDSAGNSSSAFVLGKALVYDKTGPSMIGLTVPSKTFTNQNVLTVSAIESAAVWVYSTTGGNSWSSPFASSVNQFTLAEGSYAANSVQVKQFDQAGNESSVKSISTFLTIDTTAPKADASNIGLRSDTGHFKDDFVTKDGTIQVSSPELGATWSISTDGGSNWTAGTTFAHDMATASLPSVAKGITTYTKDQVQVRISDGAGNSSVYKFPQIIIDQKEYSSINGLRSPTLAVSKHFQIKDRSITLENLQPGWGVEYSIGKGNPVEWDTDENKNEKVTQVFPETSSGTSVKIDLHKEDDGVNKYTINTIRYRLISASGTIETGPYRNPIPDQVTLIVDDTKPEPLTMSLWSDTGSKLNPKTLNDGITRDGRIQVKGLENVVNSNGLEPGKMTWEYSIDGGKTYKLGSRTDPNATQVNDFSLAPGTYTKGQIKVRQIDPAGNVSHDDKEKTVTNGKGESITLSPFNSITYEVVGDRVIPTPILSLSSDTGASNRDGISQSGIVSVSNLMMPEGSSSWTYTINGGRETVGTGSAFTLPEGTYFSSVRVRQTDAVDNISADATLFDVIVDNEAPTLEKVEFVGSILILTFNESIDANHLPDAMRFTLTDKDKAAVSVAFDSVSRGNNSKKLQLQIKQTDVQALKTAIQSGTVSLAYTDSSAVDDSSGVVQDLAGNDLKSISAKEFEEPELFVIAARISDTKAPNNRGKAGDEAKISVTFSREVTVDTKDFELLLAKNADSPIDLFASVTPTFDSWSVDKLTLNLSFKLPAISASEDRKFFESPNLAFYNLVPKDGTFITSGSKVLQDSQTDALETGYALDNTPPTVAGTLNAPTELSSGATRANTFTWSVNGYADASPNRIEMRSYKNNNWEDWRTESSGPSASFSNLSNGRYQFRAFVSDDVGNTAMSRLLSRSANTLTLTSDATLSGLYDRTGMSTWVYWPDAASRTMGINGIEATSPEAALSLLKRWPGWGSTAAEIEVSKRYKQDLLVFENWPIAYDEFGVDRSTTGPSLSKATLNGDSIILEFDKPVDQNRSNFGTVKDRFRIQSTGLAGTPGAVKIDSLLPGDTPFNLVLKLTAGDGSVLKNNLDIAPSTVQLGYVDLTSSNDQTGVVQQAVGDQVDMANTIANTKIAADTLAPKLLKSELRGDTLVLRFSEPIDSSFKSTSPEAFTLKIPANGNDPESPIVFNALEFGDTSDSLVLKFDNSQNQAQKLKTMLMNANENPTRIQLGYSDPNPDDNDGSTVLQDFSGNDMASFNGALITLDIVQPTITSVELRPDDKIALTFSESINLDTLAASSAFKVVDSSGAEDVHYSFSIVEHDENDSPNKLLLTFDISQLAASTPSNLRAALAGASKPQLKYVDKTVADDARDVVQDLAGNDLDTSTMSIILRPATGTQLKLPDEVWQEVVTLNTNTILG